MEIIHVTMLKDKAQRLSKKLILRINKIANNLIRNRLLRTRQISFTFKILCSFTLLHAQNVIAFTFIQKAGPSLH